MGGRLVERRVDVTCHALGMADASGGWPRPNGLDALGLALLAVLGGWVAFGAGDGRHAPLLWLLAGLVVAAVTGRALALRVGLVSRMVASGIAGAVVLTWPGVLQAGGAPTGYANSNATLTALGVVAALDAARSGRSAPERRAWLGMAVLLVAFTVATGSVAGMLVLGAALSLLALSALARWPGFAVVGSLIAVSLTLAVTSVIALGDDPVGLGDRAGVRAELWAAAAELVDEEPVRGIGPGEFADRTPVSEDADLRWAHHEYLQVGAELGAVGLGLVLAVAAYVWGRLWWLSGSHPSAAAVGGAALAIIGLHATVDHVWHEPSVLLLASFWLAAVLAPRS